jgi:hypothetical protein
MVFFPVLSGSYTEDRMKSGVLYLPGSGPAMARKRDFEWPLPGRWFGENTGFEIERRIATHQFCKRG